MTGVVGWIIVGVVAVGIVLWMVSRMASQDSHSEVSQDTLLKYLEEDRDMCILDVRSQREYEQGHVSKSIHMDYQKISTHTEDLEPHRRKDIIVYCEHGMRARMAITVLQRVGFTRVYHLEGDMVEWKRAGLSLEGQSQPEEQSQPTDA
ncbi:MAG: rhodanese-like domain-containing protein [Phycisphaeraceae bacterium]|nr:rhodanese-like domain-containing protein [Phycisphaeraceae bacterium]